MENTQAEDSWVEDLWVWADKNKISNEDLPRNKEKLLSLECLQLGLEDYLLNDIPKEIGMLTNLLCLSLDISSDESAMIPATLGNLVHLEELELNIYNSGEKEVDLPLSFTNITQLNDLSLYGDITQSSIDMILKNNAKLRSLRIVDNNVLHSLPNNIYDGVKLQNLTLIANPNLILTETQFNYGIKLREEYGDIEKMYCSENAIRCFARKFGKNFKYYSEIP